MLLIYGECRRNAAEAARVYAERFPGRNAPTPPVFHRILQNLRNSGHLGNKRKRVEHRSATNENMEIAILAAIENNPHVSSRELARDSGISQRSVLRILKRHKLHPYHIALHQELYGEDFHNRVAFCQWAQQQIPNFFKYVLFTDECTFKNTGHVNKHNMHYWSVDNPHWMRQNPTQRYWSLNAWGGMTDDKLIGPFFFDGTLNGERYANFLENDLPDLLEDVPLDVRAHMWYHHDGAPPHNSALAREHLNRFYPHRWIGRNGPVPWPPRSPDLTPLDFLYGVLYKKLYTRLPP